MYLYNILTDFQGFFFEIEVEKAVHTAIHLPYGFCHKDQSSKFMIPHGQIPASKWGCIFTIVHNAWIIVTVRWCSLNLSFLVLHSKLPESSGYVPSPLYNHQQQGTICIHNYPFSCTYPSLSLITGQCTDGLCGMLHVHPQCPGILSIVECECMFSLFKTVLGIPRYLVSWYPLTLCLAGLVLGIPGYLVSQDPWDSVPSETTGDCPGYPENIPWGSMHDRTTCYPQDNPGILSISGPGTVLVSLDT